MVVVAPVAIKAKRVAMVKVYGVVSVTVKCVEVVKVWDVGESKWWR